MNRWRYQFGNLSLQHFLFYPNNAHIHHISGSGIWNKNYLTLGTTYTPAIAGGINNFEILDGWMGFAGSSHKECF
jgi:hypothetical protein